MTLGNRTFDSGNQLAQAGKRRLLLTPSLLGFVVGTRAALGLGVGLLLADRIPEDRRRTLGLTLVAIGAATTIPAAISVLRRRVRPEMTLNVSQTPAVW